MLNFAAKLIKTAQDKAPGEKRAMVKKVMLAARKIEFYQVFYAEMRYD